MTTNSRPHAPWPTSWISSCGRFLARFAFSLAVAAEGAASARASASATIDLPAGSLDQSIQRLAAQTGVSIGIAGPVPHVRAPRVHRARSVADALTQLLRGTGYRSVIVGLRTYRIEASPVAPVRVPKPQLDTQLPEPEIIITARKRVEPLSQVPGSARVVSVSRLQTAVGVPGTSDVADEVASLAVARVGPGASRLFLRGIGDAPLNGFNQDSVAVLLGDARLTYNAPDPDLALVDVDRIEILEGPQGPLYGTGALGGIIKIEPNKPDLAQTSGSIRVSGAITDGADFSDSQSGHLNAPIADDRLGIRMVGYRASTAGWIDNVGGRSDSNRESLAGGRLALRWKPDPGWTVDLTSAIQVRSAADSQYVDGNLGALKRPARQLESRDTDARIGALSVSGEIGDLRLTSVTSLSSQELVANYDATPLAPALGTSGTTRVRDDRKYSVVDQEIRLSNESHQAFFWLGGLSLIKASTKGSITAKDTLSSVPLLAFRRSIFEAAAYGEVTAPLTRSLSASGGARIFYNDVEDEGASKGQSKVKSRGVVRLSASMALNWIPRHGRQFFVHMATAYRPGGLNVVPQATPRSYAADQLVSIEGGTRLDLGQSLAFDLTVFASSWRHVQADELLPNGLVGTRNVGDGQNLGVEGEVRWVIAADTSFKLSFLAQTARLESTSDPSVDDRRLPVVPHLALRGGLSRRIRIGGVFGEVRAAARYTGATHLSFDPVLDRRTRGYVTFDFGADLSRGPWTLSVTGENLGNGDADSFAFGNPFRIFFAPQRTPLTPRTIGLQLARRL